MKQQLTDIIRGNRALLLTVIYAVVAALSFYVSYEIRFDFVVPPEFQRERLDFLWIAVVVKLLALLLARQMGSLVTFFGVPDFLRLTAALLGTVLFLLMSRYFNQGIAVPPRGVLLVDFLVCLAALCSFRLGARLFRERVLMGQRSQGRIEHVAIIGAGHTGASLVRDLISSPFRGFRPVSILDDDTSKHGQFIHGVCVEGPPEAFSTLRSLKGVTRAIIAMPAAPQKRLAAIALDLSRHGVHVETVPALEDLASGKARVSRIRPIEIEDLLGRSVVDLDTTSIRHMIENKVVMVTGAGGSIGSELCRQIVQLHPRRLLIVEQSEPALFQIEREINKLGAPCTTSALVADVLDSPRMEGLFSLYQPQIVFHAAAHKHVALMERQPSEAIKNNSIGTRKLAALAVAHNAEAFVLISTDKAINPTNVMGASKRLAELHLQALHESNQSGGVATTKLMAVRFGNVLGSSGSVVPIFKKQIESGGPVTVTDPEVTRYFMTIPEAVGLVLQASTMGSGGEIFVLDMGQPMKIVDLAKNMIELSGYKVGEDIEIQFIGLKPGEKLFEELQHHTEMFRATAHPRVMRFVSAGGAPEVSRLAIERLEPILHSASPNDIKVLLKEIVPEYVPYLD